MADPAGLDAAIEAAEQAFAAKLPPGRVGGEELVALAAAIRAAAPHLRAAALNEAADETARLIAGPLPASQWGDGYVHGVTAAEQMLRERAGREFGVISGTKTLEENQ